MAVPRTFALIVKAPRSPASSIDVNVNKPVKVTGKVTNWRFELGAPNVLFRLGWKKDTVPSGLEVVVTGFQAKSGGPVANGRSLTLPGGKTLESGGSNPEK